MRNRLLFLLSAFILSGCAALQGTSPAAVSPKDIEAQRKAEEATIATILSDAKSNPKNDYKIAPGDLLEITVYRQEDLTRALRVSGEGNISFPLVGDLKVVGLSVIEAQKALAAKLTDYLVNPQVTAFIKEYANKKVSVLGEVQKPGSFDLPTETNLTVLAAISMAGGFTPVAAKDRTRVIRSTPNGQSESLIIDVTAITQQGQKDKDIPLQPNDIIFVPQTFF